MVVAAAARSPLDVGSRQGRYPCDLPLTNCRPISAGEEALCDEAHRRGLVRAKPCPLYRLGAEKRRREPRAAQLDLLLKAPIGVPRVGGDQGGTHLLLRDRPMHAIWLQEC